MWTVNLDILVNNAAVSSSLEQKPFEQIDGAEWTSVLAKNTLGPLLCSKAVVPGMRERK